MEVTTSERPAALRARRILVVEDEALIAMAVEDGLAAAGVPFLFHTGYGEGRDRGRHGAAPALHKPSEAHRLVAAVEGLVATTG